MELRSTNFGIEYLLNYGVQNTMNIKIDEVTFFVHDIGAISWT